MKKTVAIVIIIVVVLVALGMNSFTTVPVGSTGILLTFGRVQEGSTISEGLHMKLPFIQKIVSMDNRVKKLEMTTEAFSKDIQTITARLAVNYRLQPSRSFSVYKTYRMDYEQDISERAISSAATVCLRVLSAGVAAGFAANMPMGESESPALLPPERHSAREEELLSAFARLRILRCRNFLSFLDDLSFLRGTDILILSAYTSEAIEEKIGLLRRLGNTLTLHLLEKEVKAA